MTIKEIILDCQNEILINTLPNVWLDGNPTDDIKALAYCAGVNDMAQKIIQEIGGIPHVEEEN